MIPLMKPDKDPNESRAYAIDWSDHLGSDTISTSDWAVVTGSVTISDETNTTTTATVLLAGGTIMETAELCNTMTTDGGETLEQSIRVRVRKN